MPRWAALHSALLLHWSKPGADFGFLLLAVASPPVYTNLFTFNTPYGAPAADQCGRIVYTDFHVSAAALTQCPAGVCENACLIDTDCGFTATCVGATTGAEGQCDEPCATPTDCPNTTYACNGAAVGSCEQKACTTNSSCGTGLTCQNGRCTCVSDADCNGGACVSKTCDPGSACHTNAQCGNGSCGAGVGAKAGACAKGATLGSCSTSAQLCHTGSDCDSNSCGSGTGSVTGACSSNGQICHKGADCDSNVCGTGTGAALGVCAKLAGTSCHKNLDCDSNLCGTGTGAALGTCSTTAGTACHLNADCDGTCGSGVGANPTSDKQRAPRLAHWKVQYDCFPAQ